MNNQRKSLIKKCELKLRNLKKRYQATLATPTQYRKDGGEVVDMAHLEQQVHTSVYFRDRIRRVLPEIYGALRRIKDGTYGYCELTGDQIESSRLEAVPWTRISMKAHRMDQAS